VVGGGKEKKVRENWGELFLGYIGERSCPGVRTQGGKDPIEGGAKLGTERGRREL